MCSLSIGFCSADSCSTCSKQIAQLAAQLQAVWSCTTSRPFWSHGDALSVNAPAHRVARSAVWTAPANAFVQQLPRADLADTFKDQAHKPRPARWTASGHQQPYMPLICATAKKPSTRGNKVHCYRTNSFSGARLDAPRARSSDSRSVQLRVLLVPTCVVICLSVVCAQTSSAARSTACDVQTKCSEACHCYP